MSNYIKIDNTWTLINKLFKKINGSWTQQNDLISAFGNFVYFYGGHTAVDEMTIVGESSYTGKSFLLTAKRGDTVVYPSWSIISGTNYASINNNGKVTINEGVSGENITVQAVLDEEIVNKIILISYDNQLTIEGPDTMTGTSGNVIGRYNSVIVEPTWSITSGNNYGTIDSSGNITIISTGNIIVSASYNTYTTSKAISLVYDSSTTSQTEVDPNTGATTTTTTTTTVDPDTGATTETSTSTTINEDGSSSNTSSETTTNQDGSSTSTSTTINSDGTSSATDSSTSAPDPETGSITINSNTVNYDENGDTTGSSTNQTINNTDGSSTSSTTNYNAEGDPTTGENSATDTSGNVNTQDLEYDENGDPTVTGYTIDTSDNPDGSKNYNEDGVNTDYYAFDMTRGFECRLHFTINFGQQPAGQNENHHNILTAKRASPSPWYGFQLRQSQTNKYIQLGTQFSTGSNANTRIDPSTTGTTNVYEYDIRIIYDPTVVTKKFVCKNMLSGTNILANDLVFPDIDDLKYLKVTVGYAMDENGDPYRYSNINVNSFNIRRLPILCPVISCDNNTISISSEDENATIYYRLNQTGNFSVYTTGITILEDTVVEAYATADDRTSQTVTETCIFEELIATPVVYCDGSEITITCATAGTTIYYRLNHTGNFVVYTTPIAISEDTVVEAYAQLGDEASSIVEETCTIIHDYSHDYLTLRIKDGGTVNWVSVDYSPKTIQYSLNNGEWASLVPAASDSSVSITVETGDVVRFRGTNTTYASSNVNYMAFSDSTAVFDVEGNIMSLIYSDNFVNNNTLTSSFNFCSLFKLTNVESAENLILPATTLTPQCYRALFANSPSLEVAPALPATTLSQNCYRYMFQDCAITTAPDLLAETLVLGCYDGMFNGCSNLNYIKCLAKNIANVEATVSWTQYVASTGTFVKEINTDWPTGNSGIPTRWVITNIGVKNPVIFCDGLQITIDCSTQGADIYYKLNNTGEYIQYVAPISISSNTFIETYAELNGVTSSVISETCIYDDGIEEPVIYCDGEFITISCTTGGASIYYKLNQETTYTPYESAIIITEDTLCYAYSEIDGRQSEVVYLNCIYDDHLKTPVIECDGTEVTISCTSLGADIYYRLNKEGTYTLYTSPISIIADTVVEAYSERDGETSAIVTETCIYDDTHYYELDYLTFKILSNGVIAWNSIGSGQAKTIKYSINGGSWTTITASSSTTFDVSTGDVVRFKGNVSSYAKDKSNYSGFEGCTASFNVEGNIMSLVYGDNFIGNDTLVGTYNFCSLFKLSPCVSAEHLILPSTTLTNYCYRAMFSKCSSLLVPPALPATTLSKGCYWYMFEECPITTAPDLPAETLVAECYGWMFVKCTSLNYIKCMAKTGFNTTNCKQGWVQNVAASGTFVKDSTVSTSTWGTGQNGIPTGWLVYDDVAIEPPVISCDGYNNVTITCATQGATIYYKLDDAATYSVYSTPIVISDDTVVEAYSEFNNQESRVVTQTCEYISDVPLEASNRNLYKWNYNNQEITTPYSVNALDGHSASYAKGTFNFETSFALREAQPTYLWFQHADQSASVYIDDTLVEKHWGGYTAFFVDISNYVHSGTNHVKVALKNNEGNYLAPASGDFNFNATLGNVKLFTSPVLPAMNYGYDGFHVTSTVTDSSATIEVRTAVPLDASVVCTIDDGSYHYSDTMNSTGEEITFRTTIQNPHLWNGKLDPHLYTITLEIYHDGDLYHRYQRPYGLRYYSYVINDTTVLANNDPYTGFLLNGSPYLLRGCCMHDDIEGKANALNDADYTQTFSIIQELNCNFLRLAHYPHPKETYDWCDRLGIIVQTEGPCVNKMQSTMPTDYYDHLNGQYDDMVNQHYNHPCICFWGLSNETTTDDKAFANTKINGYISRIRALDSERMIGYVMAQSASDPCGYYNNPDADWFGCNIYEGWYSNPNSNDPTSVINTRIRNLITNKSKAMAYSEYGCGGTQCCHSDDYLTTTTRGNHERHDIEYMMWLHEGQIAAIKNYPQLLFTAQWQLFDIAVSNRNEGYTVCLDGENTSTDDNLRRLNNKGLVERDHITKKDTFYLYKAWWNKTDKFVHICGKDYTKTTDRTIKCYTNDAETLSLFVNGTFTALAQVTNNIAEFTAANYNSGDVIRVEGDTVYDSFTF